MENPKATFCLRTRAIGNPTHKAATPAPRGQLTEIPNCGSINCADFPSEDITKPSMRQQGYQNDADRRKITITQNYLPRHLYLQR